MRLRAPQAAIEALLDLTVVEQIRVPPSPLLEPMDWLTRDLAGVPVRYEESEAIGIIDDGLHAHPLLTPVLGALEEFPAAYAWPPPTWHGTAVAGIAAYGDLSLLGSGQQLVARGPIFGGRVLEPDPVQQRRTRFPERSLAHVAVEDAIRGLHNRHAVRLFVLAVTEDHAYRGPHVSEWTETLDRLQRELGVLVCMSAGNLAVSPTTARVGPHHALHDYPRYILDEVGRVAQPAVSALSLTVGSVADSAAPTTPSGATRPGDRSIAEVGQVSPFSRTGPGVRRRSVKPDVVEHGGNWVLNDMGHIEPENLGVSVVVLNEAGADRLFRVGAGTSFAAPRVARLVADTWEHYPEGSANLMRVLLACSSSVGPAARQQFRDDDERKRAFGYGRPNERLALQSGSDRVVLYFDGEMPVDSTVVHEIPIPDGFVAGTSSSRRIRVALAFDPPVRRQRAEYLAGQMEFQLIRGTSLPQVTAAYGPQGDEPTARFADRRKVNLQPAHETVARSTLQVRERTLHRLQEKDGDTYYLVVTHNRRAWAEHLHEEYESQRYAIAVELRDDARLDLDLYSALQTRIRQSVRLDVRQGTSRTP